MYGLDEVQALVEGYSELRSLKHKRWILIRLADLDIALRQMPPKEYQAVLLCGLLEMTARAAGEALGCSKDTAHVRYQRGLLWLTEWLNGEHRH